MNEGGALDLGGVEYGSTPYYALAAPTELAFSAYDSEAGTVVLSWADSNANTRAFRVEVSTDGGSTWTFAGEALAANPSLTLNVDAETSYIFRVRAEKTISAVSAWATAAWESEAHSTTVTLADDVVDATDGEISLREAIQYAKAGDTITFADGVTHVKLNGEHLTIDKALTIDGGVASANGEIVAGGVVTLDAQNLSRIIFVPKFTIYDGVVSFKNLTFTGGYAEVVEGALDENGENVTGRGGAIYLGGNATIENCVVKGNYSGKGGGGIYSHVELDPELVTENTVTVRPDIDSGNGVS